MRYIQKKTIEPLCMSKWKQAQRNAGLRCDCYDDFPEKRVLNDVLREEQHGLCCYCQRPMDHYQTPVEKGSHNEHLYPENGQALSAQLQMEYTNLYACCIDSRGHKKREKHLRYCGEAKEDKLIPLLIQEPDCASYFRYNVLGEIIPNGVYDNWSEYELHKEELNGKVKEACECLMVLNLNCTTLVNDRKNTMQDIMHIALDMNREQLTTHIAQLLQRKNYIKYHELVLQVLNDRLALMEAKLGEN